MEKYKVKLDSKKIDNINSLMNKGKFTIALREIKKYMEDYPNDDLGLLIYAECLLRMMNLGLGYHLNGREIEDICLKIVDKESKFRGAAWCLLGRLREIEKDYKSAETCFRSAVFFGDGEARSFLATSLLRNHKGREALDVIDSIIIDGVYSETIFLNKAIALHGIGRDQEALSIMNDIDTGNFNDVQKKRYIRTMARIYLALGKALEAKEIILDSIKDIHGYHEEHVILVRCYIKENSLEEAYRLCNKLITSFSGEHKEYATCYLGKIYELMGYGEKAREVYSTLLLNFSRPNNKIRNKVCFNFGHLELCDRNYERAMEYFEKIEGANERDISNKKLYLTITHIRLGNMEKATEIFDSIGDGRCLGNYFLLYQKVKSVILYSKKCYIPINSYFDQQLVCYRKSLLLKHCAKLHKKLNKSSSFKEDINLSLLTDEVELLIQSSPVIESNVIDKYLIYYKDIGYSDGVPTDYMEAVVIGGTNKILTMYPVKHLSEEELQKETSEIYQKKKTSSQIDKFNTRYGLKR